MPGFSRKPGKERASEVGIFWIHRGRVVFKSALPVGEGLPYGDCVNGERDHADYWEELAGKGELGRLPPGLREEYFALPRGRVVYHRDTGRFCVLHGNNVSARELRAVARSFALPGKTTEFVRDIHYCDLTDREWRLLMA